MNQREKLKREVTLADGTGRWHREPKEEGSMKLTSTRDDFDR